MVTFASENLLVLNNELCCNPGMRCTVLAGSRINKFRVFNSPGEQGPTFLFSLPNVFYFILYSVLMVCILVV